MKRFVSIAGFCVALLLWAGQTVLADTIINFDNVADATNIDSAYAGVTFSCFSSANACAGNTANSGDVYARSSPSATSAPNIVSTVQTGFPGTQDSATGAIKVSFATLQSAVSIDDYLSQASEGLGSGGYGYMQVYDSSLTLLAQVDDLYSGNSANLNVTKTLSFSSGSANIAYLLLGDVQGANIISAFDNLCYSSDSTGCTAGGGGNNGGGGTVPEPASITMLGAGLVAIVLRRRAAR